MASWSLEWSPRLDMMVSSLVNQKWSGIDRARLATSTKFSPKSLSSPSGSTATTTGFREATRNMSSSFLLENSLVAGPL